MSAGLSHGFLLFDDTGTEWTRDGETFTRKMMPNRFIYSREQNAASAPYLTRSSFRILGPPPQGDIAFGKSFNLLGFSFPIRS